MYSTGTPAKEAGGKGRGSKIDSMDSMSIDSMEGEGGVFMDAGDHVVCEDSPDPRLPSSMRMSFSTC